MKRPVRGEDPDEPQSAAVEDGITCPKCSKRQAQGDTCIQCGLIFSKYSPSAPARPAAQHAKKVPTAEPSSAMSANVEPRYVNIITIIALLFLVDSLFVLIGAVPGLVDVLAGPSDMIFPRKAKYLYNVLTAAAMFATVFGLFRRKNWARISMIVLLVLGLAEGLYMLIYTHVAIAELETNLKESFSEMKQNTLSRWVGCLLYAFFISRLSSANVKARFT
jgi:hypothetical protein